MLVWIAYNWKILVAIFFINEEHLNGITRIKYIENLKLLGWINLTLTPTVITIIILLVFGILNIGASWVILGFKNFQFTIVEKRQKADGDSYSLLLDKLRRKEDEFTKKINSIVNDNKDLIKENDSYRQDIEAHISRIKDFEQSEKISNIMLETEQSKKSIYENTIKISSEMLSDYNTKFGLIKKKKKTGTRINSSGRDINISEAVSNILSFYDKYNT